ncbi:MAG: flippase-like domain-containing protein [Candidatus Omnitrophica bacterium]|nr:flippase-like domain-containing protein [Candidatus Omnitrophota bacterium]
MQLSKKAKDVFSLLGRIAVSAAILYFVLSKIDMQKTKEVLSSCDVVFIFYAFLSFILCNLFLLLRWIIFIRALELKAKMLDVFRFFFAGLFGNLFLPTAIGGDIIKILGLCRNNEEKAKVVASVLLDRLSGYIAIVIVPLVSLAFISDKTHIVEVVFIASFLAAALLLFFTVLFSKRVYSFFCQVFNKFPRIKNAMMNLQYNISLLGGRKIEGLKAIGLSCLCQVIYAFTFVFLAKALHQEINLIYFFVFIPLLCVASVIPSIGGLGPREWGAAKLFEKIGIINEVAISMSLINFLFMIIVGLAGGLIYVFTLPSRRLQSDK